VLGLVSNVLVCPLDRHCTCSLDPEFLRRVVSSLGITFFISNFDMDLMHSVYHCSACDC
jgi:hypothetical protein